LCGLPVVGSRVLCWAWFQIEARCAGRDRMLGVVPDQGPLCRVWYHAGVVGGCGWQASDGDRSAEHAYAADRCAHEIVGFLKVVGGALAAADRQAVGRLGQRGSHSRF
jgi:hypothetical protein